MPDNTKPIADFVVELSQRFPKTPLLALGQTALWDEPVKAVLLRALRQIDSSVEWYAGVHDTDYFAKTIAHIATDRVFVALPHDDGATKDLWSAAGEMSALFGSESVPTRQMYRSHGVPFDWLSEQEPVGRAGFIARHTVAWGWLGLVQTQAYNIIAHDVPLRAAREALLEQFDWAFRTSVEIMGNGIGSDSQEPADCILRRWIVDFLESCTDHCRIPDLYEDLIPRLYTLLASETALPSTTATSRLLRFNRETCHLPRFAVAGHFINPVTRAAACASYDQAVAGYGIYPLSHFGDGAIPFDVVKPGQGRGTLHLSQYELIIDTDPEVTRIAIDRPITCLRQLADTIEAALGADTVLVGKAVTLIDMIAAEFLVVFHETASGYTPATRAFNDRLRVCGIELDLHPIVRLNYNTWDSLAEVESADFVLPLHLADSFGQQRISASEFGRTWRDVSRKQQDLLDQISAIHSPRDLIELLAGQDPTWAERSGEYENGLSRIQEFGASRDAIRQEERTHKERAAALTAQRLDLERRMGEHWRSVVQPLAKKLSDVAMNAPGKGAPDHAVENDGVLSTYSRALTEREILFAHPIETIRREVVRERAMALHLKQERRALERSPEILSVRHALQQIIASAELARLEMVREAFLTVDGLSHTNFRPTAWWFPLVDPSGAWIDAVGKSATARWEPLVTPLV